jgi:putative membrane-bound dehydrogenase-like protein
MFFSPDYFLSQFSASAIGRTMNFFSLSRPLTIILVFVSIAKMSLSSVIMGQQDDAVEKPTPAANQDSKPSTKAPPLSPAESIKTMQIKPGYRVVPVLAEPHIHEPAAIAWDGNGRLYVVEMRTYMQEIDGQNQLKPTSRVSRHEDTDGDGVYDKHTVFADHLSLPRMVLPLLDRVIIRETNTLDLKSYQDTDGDGVADKIEIWHEGGGRGGNLEHQPSGLIWNVDNWIYTTYSGHRYRVLDGKVIRQTIPHGAGQWGLTHDNVGRIFYSSAGGENPATDFQQPIVYGRIALGGEQADNFREVFPIDNVPDTQGGRGRLRENDTLNRFTASCGQSVYRGDQMPADFDGDLIICEPVGRLIRRANVTNDQGRIVVSNAYPKSEFITATDPNFRPVNSATGPDGSLYIVDMYRGIIQEGNWVRPGSYLRGIVEKYELDKNIGRGRIFRIDHTGSKRPVRRPRMLDETPAELVVHLADPNGWWRSEAQKLLILHNDKSVIPALQKMAIHSASPLGRLHALWTLEGLSAIEMAVLETSFADSDPRVRAAAMRIAEARIGNDRSHDLSISGLIQDPDPSVVIQTLLSLQRGGHPAAEELEKQILTLHSKNVAVTEIARQVRGNMQSVIAERKKLAELRRRNQLLADSVVRGQTIYKSLCVTCHGPDGKGLPSPDKQGMMLAPSLVGSARVKGHQASLTRILLNGLIGPIEGKTFAGGLMLPMGRNDDRWIADVATYIRNSWGNSAPLIEATDVKRIRADTTHRVGPWTVNELVLFNPPPLANQKQWKLTASHNQKSVQSAIDGNAGSRWDTGMHQRPEMWLSIELPEPTRVLAMTLDTRGSKDDYPRGYLVRVSQDGQTWSEPVLQGRGTGPVTELELTDFSPIRHIRVTQTGQSNSKYWSIHELAIKGVPGSISLDVKSLAETLGSESSLELAEQSRRLGDAQRGAKLFYNPAYSCAKCHDPQVGDRLGPDLAARRDGVTDSLLVDSILRPSKEIRKGFEPVMVQTIDGIVISGFPVSEDDEILVLREPSGGKEIRIPLEDIEARKIGKNSLMPAGLANQFSGREDFLDLVKFLMEIYQHGPGHLEKLKVEK